jgi:curli biogenesis system outer membrane secretion channel CsgG
MLLGCQTMTVGGGGSTATGGAGPSGSSAAAPQLERCPAPLGTLALVEEQTPALAQAGLSSPVPVLRLLIQQSGCFTVVDRGQALTRIQQEQALTGGGGVSPRLVAAQYFLTPNILFQDRNAGGGGAGAAIGALMGGVFGAAASAVNFQDSNAQVILNLTETDTGLQTAVATGSASNRDWSFAGLGLGVGGGVGGVAGLGAYADTDIGRTVIAAFLDAYSQLVNQVRTQG